MSIESLYLTTTMVEVSPLTEREMKQIKDDPKVMYHLLQGRSNGEVKHHTSYPFNYMTLKYLTKANRRSYYYLSEPHTDTVYDDMFTPGPPEMYTLFDDPSTEIATSNNTRSTPCSCSVTVYMIKT